MKKLLMPILILVLFSMLAVPAFAQNEVEVYFFYKPGCPFCGDVDELLQEMRIDNPTLTVHSVNALNNMDLFIAMLEVYNVPTEQWTPTPRTYISDETFVGAGPALDDIKYKIEYCLENECEPTHQPNIDIKPDMHLEKLIPLAAADAVSPCELAVMTMLLMAIMARNPGKKGKILLAGMAFAMAIFVSYFTFGALITLGFKSATSLAGLSSLHKLLGVLAIIIGLINLKDFFQPEKPLAEVPTGWRPKMKRLIAKTTSVPGAFVVGLLVSFFLTPCTIGPYFVAGGILSEMSWQLALSLLFVYNMIFIAPMVALIFIIYFGITTIEKSTKWRKAAWKYTHLAIAFLMFALGISMLLGWI